MERRSGRRTSAEVNGNARGRRVALVTTAAPAEGGGHLSRAVTLAEELSHRGADIVVSLLRGSASIGQQARLAALGVELAAGLGAAPSSDAVVVDLPVPDEAAVGLDPRRLVVFDDSDRLRAPAAIVVQPSQREWRGRADVGRVLAGYRWAPIRSSILAAAERRGPARGDGVVVCFGGSDPFDVGARVVPAVAAALAGGAAGTGAARPSLTAIVGAGYRGRLAADAAWTLLRDPADIDVRLAAARLALIGTGTMKFELAALGVPTVTLAVADDQGATGPEFARTGAAVYAGDGRTVDPEAVGQLLVRMLHDEPTLEAMREAAWRTIDGRGAARLVGEILGLIEEG